MRMTITLREAAYAQLQEDARDERRPVREHAAYLLERQLLSAPAPAEQKTAVQPALETV
jgi:hypothetical protein